MFPIPFPASTISLGFGEYDGKYYTRDSPHMGTDFSSRSQGVVAGSIFRASGTGKVVRQGIGPVGVSPNIDRPNNLAGNSIDVDYGDIITRYMHRPYNSPSPSTGAAVTEGVVLGMVGNTGLSGGAHLHLEVWDKRTRRRVDPARFFDFSRVVGSGSTAGVDAKPFTPDTASKPEELTMASTTIISCPLPWDPSQRTYVWITPSGGAGTVQEAAGMASILREQADKIIDYQSPNDWDKLQFAITHAWERAAAAKVVGLDEVEARITETLTASLAAHEGGMTDAQVVTLAASLREGLGAEVVAALSKALAS